MNCPSCGAPMRATGDRLECDYCHNVVVPDADSDGVRVLGPSADQQNCPVCDLLLMQASLANMPLLYCGKCHGELVPMTALGSLVEELRAQSGGHTATQPAPDAHDLQRRIPCPRCHRTMDAHFYAGPGNVIVDSCETCELIWLDHGELAHIAHAPDTAELE